MENPPPSETVSLHSPTFSTKTFSKALEFQKIVLVFKVYLTTYICKWFCCFIVLYVVFVRFNSLFYFLFCAIFIYTNFLF